MTQSIIKNYIDHQYHLIALLLVAELARLNIFTFKAASDRVKSNPYLQTSTSR